MLHPFIGVVIVNYNGREFQQECIESVMNSSYSNLKIIVVDNGSNDDSMEILEKNTDDRLILIYNNQNLGVSTGNNIGIKKSIELGCEYTLLLNNDTVLDYKCIEYLINNSLEKEQPVSVPKIYFWNSKKIWFYGGGFSKIKAANIDYNYLKTDSNMKRMDFCDYAPTCCMLINNSVFSKVGFMDENYFLYFDDTDFCFRLFQNNIRISLVEKSIIYHKVSQSAGGYTSKLAIYYLTRNNLYFRKKYKQYFGAISLFRILIVKIIKYCFSFIKKDNNRIIKKAIDDYRNSRFGMGDIV